MSLSQLSLEHIETLRAYQPRKRSQASLMKAAVAMILRDGSNGTEVLLMQRAFHPKDPWSGQMAFPGGKIEQSDSCSKAAAMREALEEVGANLDGEDYVGRLDDLYGLKVNNVFSVHIACYVFKPKRSLDLIPNEEVADMVWLPLSYLSDRDNAHDFVHPSEPSLTMPAVMINATKQQILWGLSLRMLVNFHNVLDAPMTVLSNDELELLRNVEKRELSDQTRKQVQRELNKVMPDSN
ncbi:MAG: CoA pyrophosphatase [Acidiferrobacterales bacterium]|nr:CoA pyrophosphatase [Acidiferrobacterales bacterium]